MRVWVYGLAEDSNNQEATPSRKFGNDRVFGLVWNAKDVISLHKEHRIVGKLIGCPAKTPHQSVADGLPLVLSAPEITELVAEGVITTVTDSSRTSDWIPRPLDGHAIRTLKEQYDRYREESFQGQVPAYREKRKREILANAERFFEGKKRKITNQQETLPSHQDITTLADDKKEVDLAQTPTTSTAAQIEDQRRDGFIRRQISNIKELTPEYAKIQTFYEEPFLPEGSVTQIDWESIQFGPLDQLKSATFHELRKRGFFVTSGDKFGGDFLAYPGDPLLFHAKFVVICHLPSKPPPTHPNFSSTSDHQKRRSEREQEALQVARCRLGTAVNKTVLISTFRDATSKVKFTELRWTAAQVSGSAPTMQNNEKHTPPQLTT